MNKQNSNINNIDDYIKQFPQDIQIKLVQLRKIINDTAPLSEEKISWKMPTFVYYGNLVHFAFYKNHIGFYPSDSGVDFFNTLTNQYVTTKGSIHFGLNDDLPVELIIKVVEFRVKENLDLNTIKKK